MLLWRLRHVGLICFAVARCILPADEWKGGEPLRDGGRGGVPPIFFTLTPSPPSAAVPDPFSAL